MEIKSAHEKFYIRVLKEILLEKLKAQLAGYVSEHSGYHHGEMSLIGAIINMAQEFVGQ